MSEELRKLAEAATPGPWFNDGGYRVRHRDERDGPIVCDLKYRWEEEGDGLARDVPYIAAVSPDVVLGLLDQRNEATTNAEHHEREARKWQAQCERAVGERDRARAVAAALVEEGAPSSPATFGVCDGFAEVDAEVSG